MRRAAFEVLFQIPFVDANCAASNPDAGIAEVAVGDEAVDASLAAMERPCDFAYAEVHGFAPWLSTDCW